MTNWSGRVWPCRRNKWAHVAFRCLETLCGPWPKTCTPWLRLSIVPPRRPRPINVPKWRLLIGWLFPKAVEGFYRRPVRGYRAGAGELVSRVRRGGGFATSKMISVICCGGETKAVEHLMGIPKRGPFPFYWSFRERNPFFSAGKG